MIHARKDYDRIQDPDNKIPLDEPVFLLRGQDPIAAEVVRYWARLHAQQMTEARMLGEPELYAAVETHAKKMAEWARNINRGPADTPVEQLRSF